MILARKDCLRLNIVLRAFTARKAFNSTKEKYSNRNLKKSVERIVFFLNPKGNMEANLAATVTKVPKVEVEVQIIDLKEVYDKKTKKTLEGLEYRLDDSEVTVVVQASETITSVRAFTQRCPEAAMRTHDTIGSYLFLHSSKRFSMG